MMPRTGRSWSLMLAGLAMAAIACSLGGRVIEETGIAPPPETPTESVLKSRIPPAETERIFEKFYRIGRSETQASRGSGVGLALVKHIAEAHGGRVAVESRPGEGSRFTLYLPVAQSTLSPEGRGLGEGTLRGH